METKSFEVTLIGPICRIIYIPHIQMLKQLKPSMLYRILQDAILEEFHLYLNLTILKYFYLEKVCSHFIRHFLYMYVIEWFTYNQSYSILRGSNVFEKRVQSCLGLYIKP